MHSKLRDYRCHYGGNFQGLNSSEESMACTDLVGCGWIRDAVTISVYNGTSVDTGLQTRHNHGLRIACNLNWLGGGAGAGGPKDFVTDLSAYRTKIHQFLAHNKQNFDIAVIENEEDNGLYWNYTHHTPHTTTDAYIAQLAVAVDECRKVGMKVANGGLHLHGLLDVKNGVHSANADRTEALMNGFATLRLNYVNFHFQTPDDGISDSTSALVPHIIRDLTQFYKDWTGHSVICNEYHQQEDGTVDEQNNLCANIVMQMKDSHLPYSLTFGGDGSSEALIMVNPADVTLTALGTSYRDAIKIVM